MTALDPNCTFEFTLPEPADQSRKLLVRHGTAREWSTLSRAYEAAKDEPTDHEFLGAMAEALAALITGWRGFTGEYRGAESLLDAFMRTDLMELCVLLPGAATTSELDRKKSARQSRSSSDNSAPAAAAGNA